MSEFFSGPAFDASSLAEDALSIAAEDTRRATFLVPIPSAPGGRVDPQRRLPGNAVREVDTLLRNYPAFKRELAEAQRDALEGGYGIAYDTQTGGGGVSNPTQSRALRLASDSHVRQLVRIVGAVDRAISVFGPAKGAAMRLHYEHGKTWEEVARTLSVSAHTPGVWLRQFRVLVWEQLGHRSTS